MNLKNKLCLVTGAAGFIGSHLVEALIKKGAKVRCFIRYNSSNHWGNLEPLIQKYQDIEIKMGCLKDSDSVRSAVKDVDCIFHLGALIAIPFSYTNPKDFFHTNVLGTLNVLSAAKEYGMQKIIHTSTSEVYGTAQRIPINENHPLQGQSPYSASKIGADKVVESFQLSYDLPVATIRPFNTFGPRQSARAIIPSIISQLIKNNKVEIGSTEPTRDFTFVRDTVAGVIAAAESEKSIGETINLGTGKETSIGELVLKIRDLINAEAEIITKEERLRPSKSEVMRLCADNSKAKQLLNWTPKYTLEEGLKETIEYIKNNLNKFKTNIYNV